MGDRREGQALSLENSGRPGTIVSDTSGRKSNQASPDNEERGAEADRVHARQRHGHREQG